ncbi:hypothetical protein T484DRAFT_1802461, partial [Baffinella frigidus]
ERRAAAQRVEGVHAELHDVKRMRDELYAVVMEFETQVAEVQKQVKDLHHERHQLSEECAQKQDVGLGILDMAFT